jgi:hypothetical protein
LEKVVDSIELKVVETKVELGDCEGVSVTIDSDERDEPLVDMRVVLPNVVLDPSAIKVVLLSLDDAIKPLSLVGSTLNVEIELLYCVDGGQVEEL